MTPKPDTPRPWLRWTARLLPWLALGLLLVGIEAGLRVFNVGSSTRFYRTTTEDGVKWARDNRQCTEAWFGAALARKPFPFKIPLEKAPGTVRVFVLGSSAAMGDPEPSFSLARTLEAMLRQAHPGVRFEVVNAAITAINSHLVRDIAADCAELAPDILIVYEGNNEVIGPFGPAGVIAPSLQRDWAVDATRALKRLRMTQVLSRATSGNTKEAPKEWGGMEMFLGQSFAADDPRLANVRRHFRRNLRAIAEIGASVGAQTILCTVATNERDFAPFLSRSSPTLKPDEKSHFLSALARGREALGMNRIAEAESALREATTLDPGHAEATFLLGRTLLAQGKDNEARALLSRARDLDALRFRTDSALNETVRSLSRENLPSTALADVARGLAARAPHGAVGDEFMLEHVHFSFRGTFQVALELWPHIERTLAERGLITGGAKAAPDPDSIRLALGYTVHEQGMIAAGLLQRISRPPFTGQADATGRVEAIKRRLDAASGLLSRPDALDALRQSYALARQHSGRDWVLLRNEASMLISRGHSAEAIPLLREARKTIPDDIDTLVLLSKALKATGAKEEQLRVLAEARALEPNYPGLE